MLTGRYTKALDYAADIHRDQRRKGTDIPYLSHLLAVSSLVLEHADPKHPDYEALAIAALLHDAAEDQGGQRRLDEIHWLFGPRVGQIVEACSDSLTADPETKAPWTERKAEYLKHLRACTDEGVLLVSCADKLHNARAILTDLRTHGDRVWERFVGKGGKTVEQIVGYYLTLAAAYEEKLMQTHPLARELMTATALIWAESGVEADTKWAREAR